MMDKVTLCNLALQIAGVSDRILGTDDQSLEAIVCNDWLETAADDVLMRYPWHFATKIAPLEPVNRDVPPYRYASKLPDDCLIVRDVFGANARVLNHWAMHGMDELMTVDKPVSCVYTIKSSMDSPEESSNNFLKTLPLMIAELIAARLAVCIAPPLLRSADAAIQLTQLFNVKLNEAAMKEVGKVRDVVNFEG